MTLSGISDLPLFKRRSQSAEEFESLLDLLPHPTLIADGRSGKVLLANTRAIQLTAYTRKEFAELELNTLLPDFPIESLNKKKSRNGAAETLVKRNSRSLQVAISVEPLSGDENWVAISLQPVSNIAEIEDKEAQEKQRWEAMHMLSLATQQDELASSYRQILQAGALLTGARHLLLYTNSEAGQLRLEAVSGSGVDFPTELSEADLGHLRTPKIWKAGKPLDSALHKAAHAAKLSYLASTPLDVTQPSSGLVVAADEEAAPPNELLTLLQILAASAATATLSAEVAQTLSRQVAGLSQSAQLGTALQENVQDGIVFAGPKLKITAINPAAAIMLGYSEAEVADRPVADVLISNQSLLPNLEKAVSDGKFIELGELKLHRRDGVEFLASLRLAPIVRDGKVEKLAILVNDLSEQEALHIRSQQLQQRAWLGEVTAIFAHEVRNPINNISTGLQLMQISLPEQDPMQEQIKKLQEDCDRLEHRMKSVLSFSRSLDHNPEPMDIGEFCKLQIERWRPRMASKGIKDNMQIAPSTPRVFGDRRALDQVFTNLITNAIQAMEDQENGFLAIKIAPSPDEPGLVDIHISDNGPGIPEDLRKRVFDPFFTTKEEEGTGLGLAITRRIIMAHNGHIDLESFPGGTLFKIQLPVAPTIAAEGNDAE
ncbi:MAG: ATP-binding protein [Anaerolineales bacterium]